MHHIALHLKDIVFGEKSGRLTFRRKPVLKFLFFKKGSLTCAVSNRSEERIGRVLHRLGIITDKTLSKIELYIEPKRHIGEVLIENGLITKAQLLEGLEFQMREIVLNVFPFFDGAFSFDDLAAFETDEKLQHLDLFGLISDGIRRMDYVTDMKEFFRDRSLSVSERKDMKGYLLYQEKQLLEHVLSYPGGYTPEPFPNETLYWKRLFLLFCLGLVEDRPSSEHMDEEADTVPALGTIPGGSALNKALKLGAELDKMNYYQLLDIPQTASSEEVKKAYFIKAKEFHPDLFDRNLPLNVREKIQIVFDSINKAYRTLRDSRRKRLYDEGLDDTEDERRRRTLLSADQYFHKAQELYSQQRYKDAIALSSHAVKLLPSNAEYVFFLAKAQSMIPLFRKQAESGFLRAIDLEPLNPESYLALGQMYWEEGLTIKAEKLFRKVLHFEPGCVPAQKALIVLERERKKEGRGKRGRKGGK